MSTHVQIAIIGAGFGGLGAAIRLNQEGWRDLLVFERSDEIGGTWRDNSYPGCACDVPSQMYSWSFALNPDWSRSYSGQAEIWDYLRASVRRFGLEGQLRLGHEVQAATWDEAAGQWVLRTSQGRFTADFVIAAGGPLNEPSIPDLPGLETFAGTTFHSAQWRHDHTLTGRRVAVIGTGASAIQFVPKIAEQVADLRLFQRTAAWIVPRTERRITRAEHVLYRRLPFAQRVVRTAVYWYLEAMALPFLKPGFATVVQKMALGHLHKTIKDPRLREKLTPDYTMGCKRILKSNDFYPALLRDNVHLETAGIAEIRPEGVLDRHGTLHEVDTIIYGTGFKVTDIPIAHRIHGRGGQTLAQVWQGSPKAYQGITVAGFPNAFLLLGPSTGLGHMSVVFMIESQLNYILGALRAVRRREASTVEPKQTAQDGFVREVDSRMAGTVWLRGGCDSWYLDDTGRNSTLWPGYTWKYWLRTRRFDADAYVLAGRGNGSVAAPPGGGEIAAPAGAPAGDGVAVAGGERPGGQR